MSGQRVSKTKGQTKIPVFEDKGNFDRKLGFHSGIPNYCDISKHIR